MDKEILSHYISHDKCGSFKVIIGEQAELYQLGLFPIKCEKCGDLLPPNTDQYRNIAYVSGIPASQGASLVNQSGIASPSQIGEGGIIMGCNALPGQQIGGGVEGDER